MSVHRAHFIHAAFEEIKSQFNVESKEICLHDIWTTSDCIKFSIHGEYYLIMLTKNGEFKICDNALTRMTQSDFEAIRNRHSSTNATATTGTNATSTEPDATGNVAVAVTSSLGEIISVVKSMNIDVDDIKITMLAFESKGCSYTISTKEEK